MPPLDFHQGPNAKGSVLFVDDEPNVCKSFARSLRQEGYIVDTARDQQSALNYANEHQYSVIACDFNFPTFDGLELIDRLLPIQPDAGYIIVTGQRGIDIPTHGPVGSAINSVLMKPWSCQDLKEAVAVAAKLNDSQEIGVCEALQRILLVDDHDGDALILQEFLRRDDIHREKIFRVPTVHEAEKLLEQQKFDLIISDLTLPDARSTDAVKRLLRIAPMTPLIIVSSQQDEDLAAQSFQLGAQSFILKNELNEAMLRRAIKYALKRKEAEIRMTQIALSDPLTGLPNRRAFRESLSQARQYARAGASQLALMYIDLDGFKQVNDTMGHEAGDQLLKTVGSRLQTTLRESDVVARLGGDEFAVLLPDLKTVEETNLVANRILSNLNLPMEIKAQQVKVSGSVGVVMSPELGETTEDLLSLADTAMYDAKREGKNRVRHYKDQNERSSNISEALSRRELKLFYQPIVDLRTREWLAVESLIRWQQGALLVPPNQFIPAMESSGSINQVGAWVLKTACEQLAQWNATELALQRVSVNVSPVQLKQPNFHRDVLTMLEHQMLDPRQLEIEITESCLLENLENVSHHVAQLRQEGVRVVLDDFGTGFSSLSHLSELVVDGIKLDHSLVSKVGACPRRTKLTLATIRMAHDLGLQVTAEGVEHPEQAELLDTMDCNFVQGFYFARPAPPEELYRRRQ